MVDAVTTAEISRTENQSYGLFGLLLSSAQAMPNKEALVSENSRLNYSELLERVAGVNQQLRQQGITKGDRVALLFPNHIDYVAAFFAILSLGATIVPINPFLKSEEIAHILKDSGTENIIVHNSALAEVLKSQQANANLKTIFVSELNVQEKQDLSELTIVALSQERLAPHTVSWENSIKDEADLALIVYTSGTTGKPKGAMLSHHNLASIFPARLDMFDINESDRTLAILPMCHIYGITILMVGTISRAATLFIMSKFEAPAALALIKKEGITLLPAVPAMYQFMLMEGEKQRHNFSSVRICFSGGASLAPALIQKVESLFAAPLIEGYALTETSCVATINPLYGARKPGSVGPAVPGLQIKIADENGQQLSCGQENVGELLIKGPNIMLGYYKQSEASAESIQDGWFATGDLGYQDADGYFYIVGRKKEMIIRGGQNIYPREIEEVLARMEGISEAAVIGVPDELMGERVKAIIVKDGSQELSVEAIKAYCAEYLAEYKVPRLVEFRDALPRNSTGKVLKRQLS